MSPTIQLAAVIVAAVVFVVRLAIWLHQQHVRDRIGPHPAEQERQR